MVSQVGSDHLRLLWPILWRDSSQRQRVEMVRPPRWNFALSDVCMNRISVKWIDICIVCPSFYSWVLFHLRTLLAVYFLHVPQLILALLGCPTSWAEWNGYCSWRCGITGSGGSPHASSIKKKRWRKHIIDMTKLLELKSLFSKFVEPINLREPIEGDYCFFFPS